MSAPPADVPPEAIAKPGKLKRLLTVGLVGAVCLAGPVASAVYFWAKPAPAPAHEPETVVAIAPGTAGPDVVDILIRAGSYSDALTECRQYATEHPGSHAAPMAYREAVCLEALGRLKEATAAYKRAETASGEPAASARAVLGQARCAAARDDISAARKLLNAAVLRIGHPGLTDTHIVEECRFMRARIAALGLGAMSVPDPLDPRAVAWPALSAPADKYYEWLPPTVAAGHSSGPTSPNLVRVHAAEGGFEVTAHLAERSVGEIVRAIAGAAGLKFVPDPTTVTALAGESTAIDVDRLPLDEVLDALLSRVGAGWAVAGGELKVLPTAAPVERDAVAELLQRAVRTAPKHPAVLAARVWCANIDHDAGRVVAAAKVYREVMEEAPESSVVPYAVYNLGLVELNTGARLAARSRFLDLVDRAPRSRWADYGHWWVGRTHLDGGDLSAAKTAFESALRGNTREVISAAALGTCAAELLGDKDDAARGALDEHRPDVREEHAALHAAFDALLRYRASPTETRRATVLEGLRHADDASRLGPFGTFLVGRVYRDLGLADRTAALYDAASVAVRGPLATRMSYEVAEWYDLLDRRNDARQRYLAVAATDPMGYGPKAELKLAEMALREKNAAECLRRCRTLLDSEGVDLKAVLAVMGRAYEQQRNYRAAAECFAGRVPR